MLKWLKRKSQCSEYRQNLNFNLSFLRFQTSMAMSNDRHPTAWLPAQVDQPKRRRVRVKSLKTTAAHIHPEKINDKIKYKKREKKCLKPASSAPKANKVQPSPASKQHSNQNCKSFNKCSLAALVYVLRALARSLIVCLINCKLFKIQFWSWTRYAHNIHNNNGKWK